jgi:PAS domain S-box-containing protein
MTDLGELALYRAIVASMPEGVAVIRESDGVVIWANERLASIFGHDSEGLHGRPAPELLGDDHGQQSTRQPSTRTVSVVRDDGRRAWCRSTTSKFEHPDYGPVWLAIVSPLGTDSDPTSEQPAADHRASVLRGITLPARGTFQDDLARELSRARRSNAPLSVALISLDGELDFTDPGTIDLLASATQAWREALRDSDSIAYYDFGEFEYVLLLPDCPSEEAEMVTERVRTATPDARSCSAGFATWNRSELGLQLAARAHQALRGARRAGGDRCLSASNGAS